MTNSERPETPEKGSEFERRAQRAGGRTGPLGEFWYFLRRTRNWWMTPILLLLFLVGFLMVMSSTAVAPLIYTLF